jgi:F5/8 type C domain-containing protein
MLEKHWIFGNAAKALAAAALVLTSSLAVSLDVLTAPASAATCSERSVDSVRSSAYESGNPPARAIDNDMSTRWSANGKGSWIRTNLEQKQTLCSVDIAWYQGNTRINYFVIAVSSDGITWKNVYSGKSSGTSASEEKYTFSPTAAKHVRITVYGNSENNLASTKEIDVNGYSTSTSISTGLDKFGVKKIYPTAFGGNEWYVDMANPKSDPLFRNLPSMTKQLDGSWRVSASQVRMEAWSPSYDKWLNVEITGYAKMVSGTQLIQAYSRGGHHYADPASDCEGSAYKARLYGNGNAAWVKEVNHPAYTGSKGTVDATDRQIQNKWVGFKAVIYNIVENGKTFVKMESYIDDDVTGWNGNLVVKNNWKLASVVVDRGGWGTTNSDFDSTCAPLNKDSDQRYRQRGEIINMPGGTSSQNLAAWRSDGLTWDFKYLSVREIKAP